MTKHSQDKTREVQQWQCVRPMRMCEILLQTVSKHALMVHFTPPPSPATASQWNCFVLFLAQGGRRSQIIIATIIIRIVSRKSCSNDYARPDTKVGSRFAQCNMYWVLALGVMLRWLGREMGHVLWLSGARYPWITPVYFHRNFEKLGRWSRNKVPEQKLE